MKPIHLYVLLLCMLAGSGCVNQPRQQAGKHADLERVAQWGFPISEDYLQTYAGSFCYSTTYREQDTDYFLGYSRILHAIDILDLTNKKPYKQILLDREGSNGILELYGVGYYKGELIVEDEPAFYRVDMEGKVVSRKLKKDIYAPFTGYGTMKPGLFIYMGMYNFFCLNAETGEIAITLYGNEPASAPMRILLLSCDTWEITDTFDIAYPDFIQKEGNMGVLNDAHAYPCADRILFNFAASSNVYSIDRKTKETTLHEMPSTLVDNFLKVMDDRDTGEDLSTISGYYFPLRYDANRKKFWRIQMGSKDPVSSMYVNRPYAISCITPDLKEHSEYAIPQDLGLYPNCLFFAEGVLFPYVQAPAEEEIIFYLMQAGNN